MKGKAYRGTNGLHVLSDFASSAKYIKIKKSSGRQRTMESCKQKRNALTQQILN